MKHQEVVVVLVAQELSNMKIKIICKSLLLGQALKNFLQDYISHDNYDILISDKDINDNKLFLIGKDIQKPFSKENLFKSLQKFKELTINNNIQTITSTSNNTIIKIEEEMQSLLEEYTIKINQLAKKKYEQELV